MMWVVYALAAIGALTLLLVAGMFVVAWLRPPEVPYLDADGFPTPPQSHRLGSVRQSARFNRNSA